MVNSENSDIVDCAIANHENRITRNQEDTKRLMDPIEGLKNELLLQQDLQMIVAQIFSRILDCGVIFLSLAHQGPLLCTFGQLFPVYEPRHRQFLYEN